MKKNCKKLIKKKKKKKKIMIKKLIKKKGVKLYVKWKGYDSSFNNWIDQKKLNQINAIVLHKI